MATLVDTSALYALLSRTDANHRAAARAFRELLDADELVTHSYVLLEATALVERRLPSAAVRELHESLVGPLEIVWVSEELHRAGVIALLAAVRRRVSLVDRVSFALMRERGIERAFAFDPDFTREGFQLVP